MKDCRSALEGEKVLTGYGKYSLSSLIEKCYLILFKGDVVQSDWLFK